jgi:hypothetical protein
MIGSFVYLAQADHRKEQKTNHKSYYTSCRLPFGASQQSYVLMQEQVIIAGTL